MISVVIPLFNKEASIGDAILSVLGQTYSDYEVIIVDDGSTDNGAGVVANYSDKRIRYVRKDNGGVSSARNMGISLSNGAYVAFLDADDWWDPCYLEELACLIEEFPSAAIYGFSNIIFGSQEQRPDFHGMPAGFRGILANVWHLGVPYWTSAVCIARRAFTEVGYFDERMDYGEDLDMWWRVLLEYSGAYCSMPLVHYCINADNRAMTRFQPFEKHLPFFIEKYDAYRAANKDFRFFFDRECLYRIFQYTGMKQYKADLKRVLSKIDFSLQKKSMRLRFIFPGVYRFYLKLRGRV